LSASDPDLRESALDRIGTTRPDNAINLIVPFLADPNAEVRGTAACNLGLIHDSRAIPYLIEVVKSDPSERVRTEAIASLAEYQSPEILDCLIAKVHRDKRSRRPRQEVAKQLRDYDADEAVDALVELLQDDDVFVRDHAAESLLYQIALASYQLETIPCRSGLLASPPVRHCLFERNLVLQLNRPRLRQIWERALQDRSPHVQEAAMKALANWNSPLDSTKAL